MIKPDWRVADAVIQQLAWAFLKGLITCKWKRESCECKVEVRDSLVTVPSKNTTQRAPHNLRYAPCSLGAWNANPPAASMPLHTVNNCLQETRRKQSNSWLHSAALEASACAAHGCCACHR